MNMKAWIPLGIFAGLVVLLAFGLTQDPKKIPSPLIGKKIPAFKMNTVMDENKFLTEQELIGKVSLINVWGSWCPSCRVEHPILVEYAKKHNTPVYGINWKDKRSEAIRWLNFYGNPYVASFYDPDNTIGIDFGVYGAPETFVVDKQGIIRYKHTGPLTQSLLDQKITPLIKQLEAAQ